MNYEISHHIQSVAPSVTLALAAKSAKLKASGVDVCGFTAGEPDFDTPKPILDALDAKLQEGGAVFHYTPSSGMPALRELVAEKFKSQNGLDYGASGVMVSNGAKQAVYNLVASLVNAGDEVVILAPYWVSYPEMVRAVGGVPVFVDCGKNENFAPSAEQTKAVITDKTKLLMINSPSNPTGAVFEPAHYEAIYSALAGTDVIVMSDEIYEYLVYDGIQHTSPASINADAFARTVTINGLSKAYAMTGWRLGYAGGPEEIIKAMGTLQSHTTSNPASISQFAAVAALSGGTDVVLEMRESFDQRRKLMVEGLQAIDGIECETPRGAFYAFPNIAKLFSDALPDSFAFAEKLLVDEAVAVVPGAAFGSNDFMRLSYACSNETIEKGLERLRRFVASL